MKKILLICLSLLLLSSLTHAELVLTKHDLGAVPSLGRSLDVGDVDNDGDKDVLGVSTNTNEVYLIINNNDGTYSYFVVDDTTSNPQSARFADIDGDNDLDIAGANIGTYRAVWYENLGSLNFSPHTVGNHTTSAVDVVPVDYNNDGHMDLVYGSQIKYVDLYLNDGQNPPSFSAIVVQDNSTYPDWMNVATVSIGDPDNDNDPDILLADQGSYKILWFENDGTTTNFQRHNPYTGTSVFYVQAADLDGDGLKELVSSHYNQSQMYWHDNTVYVATEHNLIDNDAGNPFGFSSVDIDEDGDIDIISSGRPVQWYENDGSANFTKENFSADSSYFLITDDFDLDGDMDIISLAMLDYRVIWYENVMPYELPISDDFEDGEWQNDLNWQSVGLIEGIEMYSPGADGSNYALDVHEYAQSGYGSASLPFIVPDEFRIDMKVRRRASVSTAILAINICEDEYYDNNSGITFYVNSYDSQFRIKWNTTMVAYAPLSISASDWHDLSIRRENGLWTMYWDDSPVLSYSEPFTSLTEANITLQGQGNYNDGGMIIDDFAMSEIDDNAFCGVRIDGTTSTNSLNDFGNFALLDIAATDGYDAGIDIPEPFPPSSDFFFASLFRDDLPVPIDYWLSESRNGIDDLTNDVKIFDLFVDSDQDGDLATLTFTIGNLTPAAYPIVLHNPDTDEFQDLRLDNTYEYTLDTNSDLMKIVLGDMTPPVISIQNPADDDILNTQTEYPINWTITDVSPLREVIVSYSLDNGTTWNVITTLPGDATSCLWTTPDIYTAEAKIKVETTDWPGNYAGFETAYTFNIGPHSISRQIDDWLTLLHMSIIPTSPDVHELFDDDLTYFFTYMFGRGNGFELIDTLNHPDGFWLFTEPVATITIDGVPEFDETVSPLNRRWTVVGGGFPTSINISDTWFTDGTTTLNFTDAVNVNWISPNVFGFDFQSGYSLATTMDGSSGYWLHTHQQGISMMTYPPSPGGTAVIDEINDGLGWMVPIVISQGDLTSSLAAFGVHPDASSDYDVWYDVITPPAPPGDHVMLHTTDEIAVSDDEALVRDIRNDSSLELPAIWNYTIECSNTGPITISFNDQITDIPEEYSVYAHLDGQDYDLRETNSISHNWIEECELLITLDSNSSANHSGNSSLIPEEFAIASAYPNPFNPELTVVMAIPELSYLNLKVYDMLGREVSSIYSGNVEAGYRSFVFSGNDLASGIYFINAQYGGEYNLTKKVILMK